MKGLLKGLSCISIFENEKEPEMMIGVPTDVKHVAHIGLDGPSAVNSAHSWMNDFKSPSAHGGEVRDEDPVKWDSQDSHRISRKSSREKTSSARDKPELPKPSKSTTTSINGLGGSSTKEKTDKTKQSKKTRKPKDTNQTTEASSKDPKKSSKRKKLKDSSCEGSSGRYITIQDLDTVSESGSQFTCASDFVERGG